jgi:hypothetical protein
VVSVGSWRIRGNLNQLSEGVQSSEDVEFAPMLALRFVMDLTRRQGLCHKRLEFQKRPQVDFVMLFARVLNDAVA